MQLKPRFIAHGAIVALAFTAVTSSLDDASRLAIVTGLCALAFLVERFAARR